MEVFGSFLVGVDIFVFKFELFVEGIESELELVFVVLAGESEGVELVGEESDFVVFFLEHVDVTFVFGLEFGDFLVLLFQLFFQKVYLLLQNGPFLFHFHPDHLQIHFFVLSLLLQLSRCDLVLLLQRLIGLFQTLYLLLE